MRDELENLPSELVGEFIFSFLNLEDIVRLETALVSTQPVQSFLFFTPKVYVEVHIPHAKHQWLQAHDYPISKAIVHLDEIEAPLETQLINEIELVDNNNIITNEALNYLPDSCFEKVVSVDFHRNDQDPQLMEELFARLHNLRELRVSWISITWILRALQTLHIGTNKNVLIENIKFYPSLYRRDHDKWNRYITYIAEYCPRLQCLSAGYDLTEDTLLSLSTRCPLLEEFDTEYIPVISTAQVAARCALALSCIHTVRLPDYFLDDDDNDITPNYAMTIPYLTGLRFVHAWGPKDDMFLSLMSQHCLKLEKVEICERSTATAEQLQQLAQNCRHLHTVLLHTYNEDFNSDAAIIGLAQRCPTLRSLVFKFNMTSALTDASILALSEHCPELQELDIIDLYYTDSNRKSRKPDITEAAVLQLIKHCIKLRRLKISDRILSEDTVLALPITFEKAYGSWDLTFHT